MFPQLPTPDLNCWESGYSSRSLRRSPTETRAEREALSCQGGMNTLPPVLFCGRDISDWHFFTALSSLRPRLGLHARKSSVRVAISQ